MWICEALSKEGYDDEGDYLDNYDDTSPAGSDDVSSTWKYWLLGMLLAGSRGQPYLEIVAQIFIILLYGW